MDIEAEKKQLEKLKEVINLLSVTKEIEFHQQDVNKKNMHFTGANGSLWIHPTLKGYDVGLSGISLTKEMYTFMCDLSGKKSHDKYGFPAQKTQPKWEVNSFDSVKKAVYRYAGVIIDLHENYSLPEEIENPKNYTEGAIKTISVNTYERNIEARAKCIEHYGYKCSACDFDFEKTYGAIGKSYIHVHHIIPISEIREQYSLDPIKDLVPVCANCHSMIHRSKQVLSVQGLKKLLDSV